MSAASVALFNQWRDLMRSWGFTVLEAAGCDTQSASSRAPNPGGLFLEHHDASSRLSGNWGALATILAGRAGIPPRLANLQFARDGQVMITCKNVANHGGLGGPYKGVPKDDVNVHSCGAEVANDGVGEPYSDALTRAIVHGEAAWAIVTGRGADYVAGHKEWAPGRKFDPVLDMNTRRAQVAAVIAAGGPTKEDPFMALSDQQQDTLAHDAATARAAAVNTQDAVGRIEMKMWQQDATIGALASVAAATSGGLSAQQVQDAVAAGVASGMKNAQTIIAAAVKDALGQDNADQADAIIAKIGAALQQHAG